jgi:hypothetical protein
MQFKLTDQMFNGHEGSGTGDCIRGGPLGVRVSVQLLQPGDGGTSTKIRFRRHTRLGDVPVATATSAVVQDPARSLTGFHFDV